MAKVLNASTDGTLGGLNASNDIVVGQKAIKEYVDSKNLGVLSDTEGNIIVRAVGSTILTIDAALSTASTNPVQNKVITNTINSKLDMDASNLSSTGQKVFDGQWVPKGVTLASDYTTVIPKTQAERIEYDLSEYLPDDGYTYEVMVAGAVKSVLTLNKHARLEIYTDVFPNTAIVADCVSTSTSVNQYNGGTVILPVGAGRKLIVFHLSWAEGTFSLWLKGYRRIGTNQ